MPIPYTRGDVMKSYPNQFEVLPFSEQFILWAVRKWVWAHRRGLNTVDVLREPFDQIGAPRTHYALDGFMSILSLCPETNINIQCTCRGTVSEDENHLLNIISVLQSKEGRDDAESLLRAWLPPAAMRWAMDQCQLLANDLAEAGHRVRANIIGNAIASNAVLLHDVHEVPEYLN